MGKIIIPHAVNLWFGEDCLTELGNQIVDTGRRVLIVTEKSYSLSGTAEKVQDLIERRGLNCLIFDEISRNDPVYSLNEAMAVARGSHATAVVGVGGVHSLMIARAVAALSESKYDAAAVFEQDSVMSEEPIPYFEVPASGRNPFLLRRESCLWDPYNYGEPSLVYLPASAIKGLFLDPSLTETVPLKYSCFLLLEQLLSAVEGLLNPRGNFMTRDFCLQSLQKISRILGESHHHVKNRSVLETRMEVAVALSFVQALLTPGPVLLLAYAAADHWRVPRSPLAAIMLPALLDSYTVNDSPFKELLLANLLPEKHKGDRSVLSELIREWMSAADLPLQLRSLQMKRDQLSRTLDNLQEHPVYDTGRMLLTRDDMDFIVRESF